MPADPPPVESTTPTAGSPQEPVSAGTAASKDKPILLRPAEPFVDAIHFADINGSAVTVVADGTPVNKKTADAVKQAAERDGLRVTTVEEG